MISTHNQPEWSPTRKRRTLIAVIEISSIWPAASGAAELAEVVPAERPKEEDPIQEILREVFGD